MKTCKETKENNYYDVWMVRLQQQKNKSKQMANVLFRYAIFCVCFFSTSSDVRQHCILIHWEAKLCCNRDRYIV